MSPVIVTLEETMWKELGNILFFFPVIFNHQDWDKHW